VGQSKRRRGGLGKCIYCGAIDNLTDEHVLPYAMGGQLVLKESSCTQCARVTGALEQRLLRGHWWPYRKKLGLRSRNPDAADDLQTIKILKANGEALSAKAPLDDFVIAVFFEFEPPSILEGRQVVGEPSGQAKIKKLDDQSTEVLINGDAYRLLQGDKIEFPAKLDAGDVTRFLAKVAHGYAISKEGLGAFEEFYLPKFILGKTDGIQTYVGGYVSTILTEKLPGGGHNRMMVRRRGDLVSVCVQLFIDKHDPPPIYEIIVGKRLSSN
jgi:hypothetical protein